MCVCCAIVVLFVLVDVTFSLVWATYSQTNDLPLRTKESRPRLTLGFVLGPTFAIARPCAAYACDKVRFLRVRFAVSPDITRRLVVAPLFGYVRPMEKQLEVYSR